ncbi:nicotinate phosphoribosyltransferase [Borrelia miyamotoi]|uniref:Nicotinate phosphoribosyltransferase n=1 Tax=Borrelia miyamotoi TaxID=47466 RepID=A0AAQ3AGV7_9SPIR|nr:nicotinate phosphoribosyltransferase [Borrelia miyamotoi]AGT27577.1 nicotinate phosphoribosyltransferase [Borrelia miyamotoi LB-2001]AJA58749.1 nicotinate phosphoribosyltransferase [Borrelia miyamotoi]AOW95832.1 nicotinate phosphoribosyltransferase [Borrelia miyamotoi]QTL83722.1 nicotinate phosphoribosyltransferase [Borrelia miyamotoi]WAZ84973.1 nicotinate phosphoribosyltransferase [Borrelia miyamotoi]
MKNLSLFTDFYELSMMNAYFTKNINPKAKFEMFFRKTPFKNGYIILAGMHTLFNILKAFQFKEEEIEYLDSLKYFDKNFLEYLKTFRLNIKISSIKEGRIVFPYEPILIIEGNLIELLLIEGIVLNTINFESLIATKTARIKEAGAKNLAELGLRRAQGINGALSASKAAYIGGADFTSNMLAGFKYNIPVTGTMAHSWVMSFESEEKAFWEYAKTYPNNVSLLIDTYDTLNSGLKNAIKVFKALKDKGSKNFSVRIDSGDLEYLSKEVRKKLDENGLFEVKIIISNELDEEIIMYLNSIHAPIDFWGVGTNLVTAKGDPNLAGVYKIISIQQNNEFIPKMKISNNIDKTTLPSQKGIARIYSNGQMIFDLIFLKEEEEEIKEMLSSKKKFIIFHPIQENIFKEIKTYESFEFLIHTAFEHNKTYKIFESSLEHIRKRAQSDLKKIDHTYKRIINPHIYKVSITEKLKNLRNMLTKKNKIL